jgi:geranylgeranyl pyrophosphate synthase/predicted secreted hydrolase
MKKALSLPAAHPESEIEWWYFHGLLDEKYLLLACFWRYRGENDMPDALTASYSLTAIDNSYRVHSTFVDKPCFRQLRSIVSDLVRRQTDPFLESFLEETAGGILFEPYRFAEFSGIETTAAQMQMRVGPCALRCDPVRNSIHLEINDTDYSLTLEVDATGPGFAMGPSGSFKIAGKRMQGWTIPRLNACGSMSVAGVKQRVNGILWFDHQWGQWSFSHPRLGLHYPEWIYFAALLDDGRSLVIYQRKQHRDSRRQRQFAYLKLQECSGESRLLHKAAIVAHDTCESLRTNNLYEYGWTVELPELSARLDFEPFHPNHEIFVFKRMRGILEVGCRLSGQIDGSPWHGWGFVEVFGDTVDINQFFWGQKKTNLAQQLEKFLPRSSNPAFLQRICQVDEHLEVDHPALDQAIFSPLWSMMDRGGKGWRSTWLTTCYYAYGRDDLSEQVRELLPVTELLHTGSLVIDDFQDGSLLRRGRPALHHEVGADLAINAGCFCYFLPLLIFEELKGLDDSQRARIYAIVANAMRQGHLGQAMDLMWSKGRYDATPKLGDFETTRAQLIEQYRLKSGSQLEAIARIAGVLAEAPRGWVEVVARYSRVFGVVFQIIDDVIGIRDGERNLGKGEGEDIHNGKLNMVLLYALGALPEDERERWVSRVFGPKDGQGLHAARKLIRITNSIERCLDFAESLIETVTDALHTLPPTDARIVMRSVPRWLLQQQRGRTPQSGNPVKR